MARQKKATGSERRRSERLDIPLEMQYQLSAKKKTLLQRIVTKNISGGGIGVTFDRPLDRKTKFKTLLYFPTDPKPISSVSEVAWCRERRSGGKTVYDVGIRHVKITPFDKERFVYLFCETMINYFVLPTKIVVDEKNTRPQKNPHC